MNKALLKNEDLVNAGVFKLTKIKGKGQSYLLYDINGKKIRFYLPLTSTLQEANRLITYFYEAVDNKQVKAKFDISPREVKDNKIDQGFTVKCLKAEATNANEKLTLQGQ